MAKPSSTRWPRAVASSLFPRGDVLLLLLAFSVIISLLTHELSRRSALAAHFEGFDSDELASAYDAAEEDDDDDAALAFTPLSPPISQSESHHGPPPPPPPSAASDDPGSAASRPSLLDLWDEDEFEGIPVPSLDQIPSEPSEPHPSSDPEPSIPTIASPASFLRSYSIEIACVSFLICFVINYFTGKRENEAIALAWPPNSLPRTRSSTRTSASSARATARTRRCCSRRGRTCSRRHGPRGAGDGEEEGGQGHAEGRAGPAEVRGAVAGATGWRKWVADELLVVAESKEVAGDLITDAVLDQVFGDKAFEKFGKWFISLHFSDQQLGSHKKILMFKFVLPDTKNMADMTRLVAPIGRPCALLHRSNWTLQTKLSCSRQN
uniref:Uncharacterized protein n=1 Tax=Ananas comosus var. bracteatus TaxID=296719 RepID=A0A6V7NGW1_ANACO|nr:unnamed protein product [Ananas comosus var. bracteatus]